MLIILNAKKVFDKKKLSKNIMIIYIYIYMCVLDWWNILLIT